MIDLLLNLQVCVHNQPRVLMQQITHKDCNCFLLLHLHTAQFIPAHILIFYRQLMLEPQWICSNVANMSCDRLRRFSCLMGEN
uniref:Uncharacterized protein n=1 Tax=Pyxicephalus adspersus TaxID=30357 RepID=A0AAV3AMW7_PYXAD|nr:TPA: hypothetical protein GDO54_000552 [Pyxicephalus adspersus]